MLLKHENWSTQFSCFNLNYYLKQLYHIDETKLMSCALVCCCKTRPSSTMLQLCGVDKESTSGSFCTGFPQFKFSFFCQPRQKQEARELLCFVQFSVSIGNRNFVHRRLGHAHRLRYFWLLGPANIHDNGSFDHSLQKYSRAP